MIFQPNYYHANDFIKTQTINGFLYICLAVWNIPNGLLWFCFIMLAQGIVVSPMSLV